MAVCIMEWKATGSRLEILNRQDNGEYKKNNGRPDKDEGILHLPCANQHRESRT